MKPVHAIGTKVIVRDNESGNPLLFGTLVAYDDLGGKADPRIPIVDVGGVNYWCLGFVVEDSAYWRTKLEPLTPKTQYSTLLRHFYPER